MRFRWHYHKCDPHYGAQWFMAPKTANFKAIILPASKKWTLEREKEKKSWKNIEIYITIRHLYIPKPLTILNSASARIVYHFFFRRRPNIARRTHSFSSLFLCVFFFLRSLFGIEFACWQKSCRSFEINDVQLSYFCAMHFGELVFCIQKIREKKKIHTNTLKQQQQQKKKW